MNWKSLSSIEQLNEIDAESKSKPVLIFKHSTRCSISSTALSRFERSYDAQHDALIAFYFLDLLKHRDISNAIANKYQVEHQSPQALLIHHGKSTFDSSHFEIDYQEIIQKVS
jgi:bacillithiol system protein YtxJ